MPDRTLQNTMTPKKTRLKGMDLDELKHHFASIGEPRFRGEQLFNWMYNHLAMDFDEMSNIPKVLRGKLRDSVEIKTLEYSDSEQSPYTGTKKFVFTTLNKDSVKGPGKIESVIIPESKRTTLCISTQVGCPLDCKFCATGLMGFKKNLDAGEIFDQYLLAARDYGKDKITNIVYMGMGEPLLNYEATVKSLRIFSKELTTGVSLKKITVSTAGIAPKIKELADTGLKVKIAFSLHSCFEDMRTRIMPINKKYSLAENIEALKYYSNVTGTRITFEYVMLKDVNDRNEDIQALVKLCSSIPSKINIIPFNSLAHMNPEGLAAELQPTSRNRIEDFADKLRSKNITVMVRLTQGDDIAAACGQLAIRN